jgi:hypothetical protein
MNTGWIKALFVRFLLLLTAANAVAQSEYCHTYEKDCRNAKDFFVQHQSKLANAANACGLSAKFLFAIVAPELTQFSYLSNKIETYSLKVFYVQNGTAYSDFSIGVFQMKPSFIENIENYITADAMLKDQYKEFLFVNPHQRQARVERVDRLSSTEWQIAYLSLFCAVMNHKFADVAFTNIEEKLRFYANAYNSGFHRSETELKSVKGAYFPHFSIQKYRYADVSVWFYENTN